MEVTRRSRHRKERGDHRERRSFGEKRLLVASRDIDFATSKAQVDGLRKRRAPRKMVPVHRCCTRPSRAGDGCIERSESKARTHELAWDVVPESAIEGAIAPRWGNYTKALSTLGGRELEEIEGTIAARQTGVSEDTHVGFRDLLAQHGAGLCPFA